MIQPLFTVTLPTHTPESTKILGTLNTKSWWGENIISIVGVVLGFVFITVVLWEIYRYIGRMSYRKTENGPAILSTKKKKKNRY